MDKLKQNIMSVPPAILSGLRPYMLLEFYDYPYLTVELNNSGTLYLNYYLSGKDNEFSHLIIEISSERLKLLLCGDFTLKQVFENPESEIVFLATYDERGIIFELGILETDIFQSLNPIPDDYIIDYEIEPEVQNVDLSLKSVQRGKILIDVYLQANSLKSSLKFWAIKNFLMPFSEMVRTSILNKSNDYSTTNVDKVSNLALNHFAINSLATTIEINYNPDLFGGSNDLINIANLFLILNSKEENDIIKSFENFTNKKIIAEYLRVLNVIIKNDATLTTKIAAPNNYFSETFISRNEAQIIKNIINEKIPMVEDIEEIQGYLLELSFDKSNPTFSMNASFEDLKYKGEISETMAQDIKKREFKFITKEYLFTIHTLYVPETGKSPEKITRTLLDIKEI